jgi:hypothetical protein
MNKCCNQQLSSVLCSILCSLLCSLLLSVITISLKGSFLGLLTALTLKVNNILLSKQKSNLPLITINHLTVSDFYDEWKLRNSVSNGFRLFRITYLQNIFHQTPIRVGKVFTVHNYWSRE